MKLVNNLHVFPFKMFYNNCNTRETVFAKQKSNTKHKWSAKVYDNENIWNSFTPVEKHRQY